MDRRGKSKQARVQANRPLARKSAKGPVGKVSDLEKRLAEALKREADALERQTATSEILRVISQSQTDVQPVFETMAANALRLCDAELSAVFRFDGELIHLVALNQFSPEGAAALRDAFPMRPGKGSNTARAILTRGIAHIPDLLKDPEYVLQGLAQRANYRSNLSVPMLRDGHPIGAITVAKAEPGPFPDNQIELLRTFADQAVIAIENVRLFQEVETRNRELTETLEQQNATAEILGVISRSPTDIEPVMHAIAENAGRVCSADDALIFRVDGDVLRLVAAHGPIPISLALGEEVPIDRSTLSGRSVIDRRTIQVDDLMAAEAEAPRTVSRIRQAGYVTGTNLVTPLLREGTPLGTIVIRRIDVRPFTERQVALLQTFADQAVIAIENVRLFTELREKNQALTVAHAQVTEALEQQTATSEILRVISASPTDVQPVFDAIARSGVGLCGAVFGAVFRFDGDLISVAAHQNWTPEIRQAHEEIFPMRPHPGSVVSRAILEKRVVHIHDLAGLGPEYPYPAIQQAMGGRSAVLVPMLREDQPLGVIVLYRQQVYPFSESEIALLQTFADQAVIAIENVRLFNELRERTAELTRSVAQLTALGEVGRAVSSTLDVETVLQTIVMRANQLAGTAGCNIWEYDALREEFRLRASHYADERDAALLPAPGGVTTIPKGQGLTTQVVERQRPVQIPDIAVEGTYESPVRNALIDAGHRALLGVPLMSENEVIGVLGVISKTPGKFAPEIVQLLSTFGAQSALALQNARLFHEVEDKSRLLEAASRHKSEFLANMSHELRTPLNAIIGFSEVLAERMFGEVNEKQAEYLQDILASGRHLLSLINDILDLSKVEAGRLELELGRFHLPTALDNALTFIRERATRHGITLTQAVDPGVGDVVADERKVKQALLNLLSNALKFTPEGGRIDVSAREHDGVAEIAVTDTGVGIAPEDQEAVFEEFRQVGAADKKVEGTGLGLALSRKFIELHGGRIWVKSQVGQGSTFTFTLPVRRGE